MTLLLWLIFFTAIGACVGSFLNVVIYRLPEGKSIVTPPSSCPHCGHTLRWFENVPVLAWFYLGGKCRKCKAKISFQYPLIEAVAALLFGGWFAICYFTDMRPDFSVPGFANTWPVYVVSVVMFAGLLAATVIDARYYIIPLPITWIIAGLALVVMPLTVRYLPDAIQYETLRTGSGPYVGWTFYALDDTDGRSLSQVLQRTHTEMLREGFRAVTAIPLVSAEWLGAALGAAVGLLVSLGLLALKVLPRSFAEITEQEKQAAEENPDNPEAFLAHPHPRWEVLKEAAFLALPLIGALAGYVVMQPMCGGEGCDIPLWLRALAGVALGYLVGGAVIWFTRIFGTLGFGKEAMGLGDVHLLACIGAVVGWEAALLTFFIAPFIGLGYTAAAQGVGRLMKRKIRIIPYGPHLAAAALGVCIFHQPLMERAGTLLRGMP